MITTASLSDVNQIAVLNRQFHLDMPYFPWDTPEWIEQEIRAGHYYVIRDADGIVGALCLHTNSQSGVAEIEAMATRANLHGQGIGRLLVEYAITLGRALNFALSLLDHSAPTVCGPFTKSAVLLVLLTCGSFRDTRTSHFH